MDKQGRPEAARSTVPEDPPRRGQPTAAPPGGEARLPVGDLPEPLGMEAQLRESEQRYRLLVEAANSVILTWDTAGTILFVNDFGLRFFGYPADELVGRNVVGTIVPEAETSGRDLARLMREIQADPDRFADNENENLTRDGRRVWVRWANKAITDRDGRLTGILSVGNDVTERRRAQEELAHSHDLMRYVIEHSRSAIAVHDRDLKYVYVSQRYLDEYKVAAKDVIGRHHYDVFPDLPQKWRDVHQRALEGEVLSAEDDPYEREDGSVDWTRWECRPWFERDGSIGGFIVYTEVITERKRAEERIRKSELQLRESQRIAHVGSWEHNLKTDRESWSDELFHLLGLDRQTVQARFAAFFDRVHPEDQPALKAAIERTVARQTPFDIDYRVLLPDGATRVLRARGELADDEAGNRVVLRGTAQDVTERKRQEEALRRNEEFVRSILDTVDEGFLVIGRDYRILTANRAFCVQAGRPCEEIVGASCHEVSHGLGRPCFDEGQDCPVRRVFETGEPVTAQHWHCDRSGRGFLVEAKAFPVKDASGAVASVIQTINDITEKQLLEEERLKTQKLESIGTLAGGIAHDFNNLLQGIFGYISMAKMTLDPKARPVAMLEKAEKALHQAVNLTTQLLTFSKGGRPVKEPMALGPVIETAAQFALSGSRADCRLLLEPDLWPVEGDAGQLAQVIQNIVLNADQAMPLGGSVVIAARNLRAEDAAVVPGLAPRGHVLVSIRDTGVGIPEKYLDKIFDPYFTTKERGSGLGLATSYSIVRNHGGQLRVSSEVGKGTEFSLYLPAAAGEAPASPAPPVEKTADAPAARILVMDDEEIVRDLAVELLQALGHEADTATHGEEAQHKYRAALEQGRPYHVVILDLTVRGGMGGAETLEGLLRIDPGVKAVVSSGYSDDAVVAEHRKHGFSAALKKPYRLEELRAVLESLTAR